MAFNTGWSSITANDLGGGDFDWYDGGSGGEYLSPDQGGYPGGIPGYDDYVQGQTGPIAPDTPYDPYADEGPSEPTAGVPLTNGPVTPDVPEVTITDTRPDQTYDDVPEMVITDNRPTVDEVPEMVITDTRPVQPVVPEVPEMVITDTRPTPQPEPEIPEMTITDNRPVKPVEPEVPEMVITDDRPVTPPPVVPDVITPPPYVPPVIEEPPYVPPVVTPPPYVPPVVQPPPVTPPPVTPPPVTPPPVTPVVPQPTREMINPGFIQPRAFYNTTNDAQSKFFWGGHGPQFGTTQFDARAYNQAAAPSTPWGLGQVAQPLTPAEIQSAINGTYQSRQGTPAATRAEAYQAPTAVPYQYGQVKAGAPTAATTTGGTTTGGTGATKDLYTADQKTAISTALGSDWQAKMDKAALNGDYATIAEMQRQIDSILNPVVDRY